MNTMNVIETNLHFGKIKNGVVILLVEFLNDMAVREMLMSNIKVGLSSNSLLLTFCVGFADYWLKNFSIPMLTNQLQLLKHKQEGKYVAPRVLQQILNYIETAIGHAHTWKILKNVYQEMLVVILFPLLCFR